MRRPSHVGELSSSFRGVSINIQRSTWNVQWRYKLNVQLKTAIRPCEMALPSPVATDQFNRWSNFSVENNKRGGDEPYGALPL